MRESERKKGERGEREGKKKEYDFFLFLPSKGMGIFRGDKGFKEIEWVKGK